MIVARTHFTACLTVLITLITLSTLLSADLLYSTAEFARNTDQIVITVSGFHNKISDITTDKWQVVNLHLSNFLAIDHVNDDKLVFTPFTVFKDNSITQGTPIEMHLSPCTTPLCAALRYYTREASTEWSFPLGTKTQTDVSDTGVQITFPTLWVEDLLFQWQLTLNGEAVDEFLSTSAAPMPLLTNYLDMVVSPRQPTDDSLAAFGFSLESDQPLFVSFNTKYVLKFNSTQPTTQLKFIQIDPHYPDCDLRGFPIQTSMENNNSALILDFSKIPVPGGTMTNIICPGYSLQVPKDSNQYKYELRWGLLPYGVIDGSSIDPHGQSGILKALSRYHAEQPMYPFKIKYSPFSRFSTKLTIIIENLKEHVISWDSLRIGEIPINAKLVNNELIQPYQTYTLILKLKNGTVEELSNGLPYNPITNILGPSDIFLPKFNYKDIDLIHDVAIQFNLNTVEFPSQTLSFDFKLGYTDQTLPYRYSQYPSLVAPRRGGDELIALKVEYNTAPIPNTHSIDPIVTDPTWNRQFTIKFITNDVQTLNYDFSIKTNATAGIFQVDPSNTFCLFFIGETHTAGSSVPAAITPDAKGLTFKLTQAAGLTLPKSSQVSIKCSGYTLSPTTEIDYVSPLTYFVEAQPLPQFYDLNSPDSLTYRYSSLLQLSIKDYNTTPTPGPDPSTVYYDFKQTFDTPLDRFVNHVTMNLGSVPPISPQSERYHMRFTIDPSVAIFRAGSMHQLQMIKNCGADSSSSSREFTLNDLDIQSQSLRMILYSPICPQRDLNLDDSDSAAADITMTWKFTFAVLELKHSPFVLDFEVTHDATQIKYTPTTHPHAAWTPAMIASDARATMIYANVTKQDFDPKDRPYYATFSPISVGQLVLPLPGRYLGLTSNATGKIGEEFFAEYSLFEHLGTTPPPCTLGKLGQITPTRDAYNFTLVFDLKDARLGVNDDLTIDCPGYYIHLTDETRTTPLSWTLESFSQTTASTMVVDSTVSEDVEIHSLLAESSNQFTNKSIQAIASWSMPAMYDGPPVIDEGGNDHSNKLLLVLSIFLALIIIGGLIYFAFQRGIFENCRNRCNKQNKRESTDILVIGEGRYEHIN